MKTPGIVVHQFGPELCYTGLLPLIKKRTRVEAQWRAEGETVLVSLLVPHRDAGDRANCDVRDRSTADTVGFEATGRDGSRVAFAAARHGGQAKLSAMGLAVDAEILLVVGGDDGLSGMVLGASSKITLGDRGCAPPAADLVFRVKAGELAMTRAVLKPIDPPTIGPAVNVFSDAVEMTLRSTTPGCRDPLHARWHGADGQLAAVCGPGHAHRELRGPGPRIPQGRHDRAVRDRGH